MCRVRRPAGRRTWTGEGRWLFPEPSARGCPLCRWPAPGTFGTTSRGPLFLEGVCRFSGNMAPGSWWSGVTQTAPTWLKSAGLRCLLPPGLCRRRRSSGTTFRRMGTPRTRTPNRMSDHLVWSSCFPVLIIEPGTVVSESKRKKVMDLIFPFCLLKAAQVTHSLFSLLSFIPLCLFLSLTGQYWKTGRSWCPEAGPIAVRRVQVPGMGLFVYKLWLRASKRKTKSFERRMSKISSVKGTPFGRSAFRSLLFPTVLRRVCK